MVQGRFSAIVVQADIAPGPADDEFRFMAAGLKLSHDFSSYGFNCLFRHLVFGIRHTVQLDCRHGKEAASVIENILNLPGPRACLNSSRPRQKVLQKVLPQYPIVGCQPVLHKVELHLLFSPAGPLAFQLGQDIIQLILLMGFNK
ncbi:MAG: hypothetical protein ACLRMD_05290 [Ruminococcus sp.]